MTADINSQELKTIINEKDCDQLLQYVKPKYFIRKGSEAMPDASILAQMCQLLVSEDTPDKIKILCLKCVGNSCIDSYKCKRHTIKNVESVKYSKNLYDELVESDLCKQDGDCDYPHDSHFPYDGVIEWAADYIKTHGNFRQRLLHHEKLPIFMHSIQFLNNLLFMQYRLNATFADNDILSCLNCDNLKQAILRYTQYDDFIRGIMVAGVACIYVYNALKTNYLTMDEKDLCSLLLKPSKCWIPAAIDALFLVLHRPNVFEDVYSRMTMSEKIELLDIIYAELWESWRPNNTVLKKESAEFLALTFCKKSDLILKTVDTYVNSVDPTEIILILHILGFLTTQYQISENAKRLLINCKYLLMSLHMIGKEAKNYFTPITDLSKSAPHAPWTREAYEAAGDPEEHPAYGFKAGLIRVIANMVHRNKMCQDLFREIDGIPLLLDCTSIDARNPLISQWTTLAIRNLCEGNPENQEIIKKCKKTGVSDNPELKEMGLTLHEDADGKSIRIAPLRRD
ncbi:uncharacterized protein [Temnothorax nylanderi]|uniref:uncharacterized protein n=1 Tax=Temnothorax nylanderi TaxID=102681 RepID=UPI003A87ECD1